MAKITKIQPGGTLFVGIASSAQIMGCQDEFLDEPENDLETLAADLDWEILSLCSVCSTAILPDKPAQEIEFHTQDAEGENDRMAKATMRCVA